MTQYTGEIGKYERSMSHALDRAMASKAADITSFFMGSSVANASGCALFKAESDERTGVWEIEEPVRNASWPLSVATKHELRRIVGRHDL